MNTVKSFWVGWGSLCVAGGTAYFFAKRSINADRAARFEADQKRRAYQESLEYSSSASTPSAKVSSSAKGDSKRVSSSADAGGAPAIAAVETKSTSAKDDPSGPAIEKSKYEASVPYRTRRGDRFS